jgi:ATP-binding cassette subfamily C protein CydD
MLATGMTPVLVLAYVYILDVRSGVILTVTLPILIVFMILIGLASKKRMDQQWESYRTLSNHFVDSLRGLETLKFLGRSKQHSESIQTVSNSYREATVKTLRIAFLSSFALDFFTMLSVASVAVNLGLRLIDGHISLLPALTVLILAPEYFLPVRMVGADYHATLDGKEAGEAMNQIINTAEAREAQHVALPANANLNWKKDSTLTLRGIGLSHEHSHIPSVSDVSLEISGLRKIGIVGESGAGKSTLIDMLGGFLSPTTGEFDMDGVAVHDLMHSDWREQITYIPQSPYIFSGTLSQNIAFYSPDATNEQIQAAAEAAGLGALVSSLPQGYDEPIGGGGRALSGGQEQRVALARALLTGRPIILLDEPTAHLDIETEYELKETMLPLFEDRLVILATHRLHWMSDMDEIIVMEQGKVVERGSHEGLMQLKGAYYGMLHLQQEGLA